MSDTVVEKATGESVKGLAWMAAGAAAVAVVVAPYLQKFLGVSATIALILGGAALAFFAKGVLRKMGQGAAVLGVASWAVGFLGPMFARLNPFGAPAPKARATGGLSHRGVI